MLFAEISSANAQSDAFNSTTSTSNSPTLQAYDISGKPIPTGNQFTIDGTAMLNERFENGIVRLKSGQQFKDVPLNFSLVSNELYFKKDSEQMVFVNPVEQFALPVKDNGKEKTAFFKSGYPAIGRQNDKSFYQVLTGGPKLELLKYEYKTAREHYSYGGPVKKAYELRQRLYVYDVINGKIFEIGNSSASIKRSLPAYENDINEFASQNKVKFKNDHDIELLVAFINQKL